MEQPRTTIEDAQAEIALADHVLKDDVRAIIDLAIERYREARTGLYEAEDAAAELEQEGAAGQTDSLAKARRIVKVRQAHKERVRRIREALYVAGYVAELHQVRSQELFADADSESIRAGAASLRQRAAAKREGKDA